MNYKKESYEHIKHSPEEKKDILIETCYYYGVMAEVIKKNPECIGKINLRTGLR